MTRISRALALTILVGPLVACSEDAPASPGAVDAQPDSVMPPGTGTVSAKGLAYKCTYQNTRTTTVTFGDSLSAEQCMLLSWYYPSQGSHFCIDDSCSFRP